MKNGRNENVTYFLYRWLVGFWEGSLGHQSKLPLIDVFATVFDFKFPPRSTKLSLLCFILSYNFCLLPSTPPHAWPTNKSCQSLSTTSFKMKQTQGTFFKSTSGHMIQRELYQVIFNFSWQITASRPLGRTFHGDFKWLQSFLLHMT